MLLRRNLASFSGFALGEALMAVAVIAVLACSSIYTLFSANRYVVRQRLVSAAKALCQERIDEALTQPLTITKIPAIFGGSWPLPAVETQTATETVPLYIPEDSATASVSGIRKTWVTGYTPVAGNPSFAFAKVRVRVEFWYQGRGLENKKTTDAGALPLFYEMTTLRSPD